MGETTKTDFKEIRIAAFGLD